jgi:hypothetical protein
MMNGIVESVVVTAILGNDADGYTSLGEQVFGLGRGIYQKQRVGQIPTPEQFNEFYKFYFWKERAAVKTRSIDWKINQFLAGDAGRKNRSDDGVIHIKISIWAMLDVKLLYHTVGHELIHAADYANGNYDRWKAFVSNGNYLDKETVLKALMEYHAYKWDAATEVKFGTDFGAAKELEYYRKELLDMNLLHLVDDLEQ